MNETEQETLHQGNLRLTRELIQDRDALRAENTRLREALEAVMEYAFTGPNEPKYTKPDDGETYHEWRNRVEAQVRAALEVPDA